MPLYDKQLITGYWILLFWQVVQGAGVVNTN